MVRKNLQLEKQKQRKMEIILDRRKENCFLCLQTVRKDGENKLCLKNICRFLQINILDVLLEGLKEGEGDIDTFNYNLLKNMRCNFSVTLCNPCYGVAGKLTAIIHNLEVAHLQVNYYSEVFHKILEKADLSSAATNNSETADALMVKYFRKKAKQKCVARNKRALATKRLPLVRLNKLTKETVTTMNNCATVVTPGSALNDVGDSIIHSNNSTVKYEYSESFRVVDAAVFGERDGDAESTGHLLDPSSPELNEVGTEISRGLRNHVITEHAFKVMENLDNPENDENYGLTSTNLQPSAGSSNEKTLSQLKLSEGHQLTSCSKSLNPNITMSYPVVERVVVEEWIHSRNNQESTESQILEDSLTCDDWNDALVVETENSNESFTLLQQTQEEGHISKKRKITDSEEILNGRDSPYLVLAERKKIKSTSHTAKTSKGPFRCNHCNRRFPQARNLELHLTNIHPEQVFMVYKPANTSASDFADSCRKILEKETEEDSNNTKKTVLRQCAYCKEIRSCKQYYAMHLVYSHRKIIGEKIRAFKNEQERGPLVFMVVKEMKRKHISKSSTQGRLACKNCKSRFSQPVKLRNHMISLHPEQIFLTYKPGHRSESQFADSCRKILKRETVGYSHLSKNAAPRQCSYCTEIHSYKMHYLRHLVYAHTKIVGEKVRAFENEELLHIGLTEYPLSEGVSNELKAEPENRNASCTNELKPENGQSPPLSVVSEEFQTNFTVSTSNGMFLCNHCTRRFPQVRNLRFHMVSHHPDQIFSRYKPAHISASDFRDDSCRQIFERETVGYYNNAKKKTAARKCAYCTEYHQYKRYYLQHLVYFHSNIMGEKIRKFARGESENGCGGRLSADAWEELPVVESENCNASSSSTNQQTAVLDNSIFIQGEMTIDCGQINFESSPPNFVTTKIKKMEKTKHTSTMSKKRFDCSHCIARFPRLTSLHFHMIRVHLDQLFLSVKPAHRSESQFSESCRKILEIETVGYSNNAKNAMPQQCAYCTEMRRYTNKRDYLRHLVYSHTRIMREKMKAYEDEEEATSATTTLTFTSNIYQSETDFEKKRRPGSGNCGQVNCAGSDNHNYPAVVRVDEVDQIRCQTQDSCQRLLTAGDWNDLQVEDIMIKTEDYSDRSSKLVPILVDPLSDHEFNNCTSTNINPSPFSSCDAADVKYVADNGFV